ncbi:MAG: undecaprenyl-phosphate glucose phosphotransferase [Cyclobacteriaceae bacterium]
MDFLYKLKRSHYSKSLLTALLLIDILIIIVSFRVSVSQITVNNADYLAFYQPFLVITVLLWVITSLFCDVYQTDNLRKISTILVSTLLSSISSGVIIALYVVFLQQHSYPQAFLTIFVGLSVSSLILIKILLFLGYKKYRSLDKNRKRVIIIGYTPTGKNLHNYFVKDQPLGYRFMGFFDDGLKFVNNENDFRGNLSQVKQFCLQEHIDEIYYALPNNITYVKDLAKFADDNYIYFGIVQDAGGLDQMSVDTQLYDNGRIPILSPRRDPLKIFYNRQIKRAFDIFFSSAVILFLFPFVLPPIALLIKLDSSGPIFFKQLRSGRNGKPFWCYKFRTMKANNKEANSKQAEKNDSRITKVGQILRKTSLDELPQFFNVFLGDMSVVGPRPHMLKHTEEYSEIIENFKVRHFINSGITGYAQVNGFRGETKDDELMKKRVEYDTWYLENWSLSLDIKIIFQTVWNAVRGEENAY